VFADHTFATTLQPRTEGTIKFDEKRTGDAVQYLHFIALVMNTCYVIRIMLELITQLNCELLAVRLIH
jgi:hypothetical protein